ncbi:thiamine phosphate synthase [Puniceicoccus vermicola]|uniref:Thiamine-phosphate synthase n=1 Tax=Puniceicoccus vermicola TaxID=388746 RepID=A0A7X1B0U2_9BACT|nr:thiamine phosphate synthase [Puniceicoccus vermicola]MBC2603509.1 thiamine phosphate synthase [Puniceicoccus vermicola]
MKEVSIQCLTLDGISLSHEEQVSALCEAGAHWIQLRMKSATDDEVEKTAKRCLEICRKRGVKLILNDRAEVAQRVGADGVHLGKLDMPWNEARALLGADFLIGGTVNSVADAKQAVESRALDYVGVGPFRFTRTKKNLAPTLTEEQWREIVAVLDGLPAYAIGGIEATDLGRIRELGLQGFAISSGLFVEPGAGVHYPRLREGWDVKQLAEKE